MIDVLLVDDHLMFLDGVKAFLDLDEDIRVVSMCLDGIECLEFLQSNKVDVVVLDITMEKMDGIETTRLINQKYPDVQVLILSMFKRKSFVVKLLQAGAAGYVLKDKSKDELVGAIHNVYNGIPHYGLEVLRIASEINRLEPSVQLTPRELEIVCLVAQGKTTKEISEYLNISILTVNTHRRNVLHKLELRNATELTHYAIREGLISLD